MREQVGIPAYMITSNGARVHDVNDQLMYSKDIESDLVQPILDLVKHDSDLRINLYHNDQWLINQEDKLLKEFHKESKFSYSLFDIDHAPEQGIAKIFLIHTDHDHLAKYETKINEKFSEVTSVAFSTPNCLEIMGKSVSKGAALDAVAQTLGFTLQQCIAFGDGMNDAEMLSMAGKRLGYGNRSRKK